MATVEHGLWCVVPAAGSGSRFGADRPKQYTLIAGKPVLQWTIERLLAHPRIAGVLVVLAGDDDFWPGLGPFASKTVLTAMGGGQRSDSVLAGLRALPDSVAAEDFVLVHDAARPCVRHADIDALIERASPAGGGLLAAPVRDTLKRADASGRVAATESRESRWRAFTPQMFRRAELDSALESAAIAGIVVSDEAMAMERAGFRPLLVEGRDDNLKLTTQADRAQIEFLLLRGVD
ncbi:2-C-methyl-D-erythritol 4-phosphate cytidylyltransferase [Dokdonella immobilis]|uniref:2-C-methyl-D-erythritol 4-phosphate cytidylyltransferase n=1 Tax=Dokdonella immobilis TaxID=578942 RepID=A0A1I4V5J8_9GAMM|nr:2-C-methyl-D-erythritol 4-phosphate cytidylyltransferase [Dokdonella immobilis]SFM96250.1 2-C-methyl-D-erythritol 4-phosphate cytidylyltransferase [Dokdonella immobilis]